MIDFMWFVTGVFTGMAVLLGGRKRSGYDKLRAFLRTRDQRTRRAIESIPLTPKRSANP